jgi:hypothetical protein
MKLLTDEDLDKIAFEIPHVKAWLKAVERELLLSLERGVEFKNVKLEPKNATRKWCEHTEEGDAFDVLTFLRKFSKLDIVAPRVPLSPTQAEKTLGREVFAKCAQFVVKQSSGMKLAYTHPENEED